MPAIRSVSPLEAGIGAAALVLVAAVFWFGPQDGPTSYFAAVTVIAGAAFALAARRTLRRLQEAEARVRAAEERFEIAVDGAGVAVWDWNERTGELYWSPPILELLGLPPGAAPRLTDFFDRVHPDDRQRVLTGLGRFQRGAEGEYRDTYRLQHDDGGVRWIQVRAQARRDAQGRAVRIAGSVTDMTAERQAQAEVERQRDELAVHSRSLAHVAERLETATAVAQQERQRAELANQTKSQFLAMMSHELRTPLNAVLGFSEVIREASFGAGADKLPVYRQYAAYVHEAGTHLLSLINDILDLSKIEAGRMELHPEEIDPAEAVQAAMRFVVEQAHRRGVRITADLPSEQFRVVADSRALRQMIVNLLANAVKFTERSGSVRITMADGPAGFALAIADTGIGMTRDEIDRALQPFGQIHNSMTRTEHGTGLGLPMVKGLMELHGGRLEIESAPGRGTTAVLRFPPAAVARSSAAA